MSELGEKQTMRAKVSHFKLVASHSLITDEVLNHPYPGSGTEEDPYAIEWIPNDPRNPMRMSGSMKWLITVIMAFGTLAVSFSSTAFSGAILQIKEGFDTSTELAILSVSLFVLGFALGPMTWAPMSELYGRQIMYVIMFGLVTIFGGASIGSSNIQTLLVLRFFAGVFGASSIVNSAGVISDMFEAKERGLAVMVYTSAPFLGPTLGPIAGGFLGQYGGWRWVDAMTVIFTGVLWVLGLVLVPETYTPYLLIHRAAKMTKMTGKVYKSKLEIEKPKRTATEIFNTAIARPWIILIFEPTVLLLSIYSAIVYGILYLIFTAFPIVFESQRGWSQGISGLSYLGVMIGQIFAMFFYIYLEILYRKKIAKDPSAATPEARLVPALIGGALLPVGLFWFAWTTDNSIPWIVCILGGGVFGFGQVLLFISLINYVIDAYTVFAASALAANAILRALFGAVFPLFTTYMYANLGVHWASSVPAFLALGCAPLPFLFNKWGYSIRMRSKYASEAKRIMDQILAQQKAKTPEKSAEEAPELDSGGSTTPTAVDGTTDLERQVQKD